MENEQHINSDSYVQANDLSNNLQHCEEEHSSEASSIRKDDSGITLEVASSSSKSEACDEDANFSLSSPPEIVGNRDTASDVDMSNDFIESLNDSAIPSSSSISESSNDVKYKSSPPKCDVEKEEENVVDKLNSDEDDQNTQLSKDRKQSFSNVSKVEGDEPESQGASGSSNKKDSVVKKSKSKSVNKVENVSEETVESTIEVDVDGAQEVANEDSLPSLTSSEDEEDNENKDSYNLRPPNYFSSRLFSRRRQRRRRRRNLHLSSDDDSSSSDDDNDESGHFDEIEDDDVEIQNTDSTTDSDVSEITDNDAVKIATEIIGKAAPVPNWCALQELSRRQYGCTQRESLSSFNEKVQGSIQMARRLQLVDSMKYHEGCVNSLCFNRIGTLLASGSDDLNVVLWNWQRGRPSLIYDSGHRSNVFQAKFMPYSGDCHVVSCARDGQVRLAELSLTGVCKNTRKLAQHKGAAHKLALEYDSANVFLSCGEDAVTYLFDLREERPHRLVITKESEKKVPLYSIHSNPSDSRQFCVGGRDHYIRVYDKRKISEEVNGGVLKKLCPDHLVDSTIKANVTCACYNYNGTEIIGSYNDEDIYLFDNSHSDGANYTHRYRGHRNNATVKGVNFYGPKSEFVVSGSDCGNLYIWEKETESIITFLEGDRAGVINVLEPHPCLPILATSGLDHEVKLWMPTQADPKIDTARLKRTIQKNVRERRLEAVSEPTVMSGQMLWMIMHHFRNTARRRLREEGQELSSSDEEEENGSEDSDATEEMNQCAQS